MRFVKPLDAELVVRSREHDALVTVEENVVRAAPAARSPKRSRQPAS
jgi:deoxyxylulose-5-phosphate synthase